MSYGFDTPTQRRFSEGSKALGITLAVLIFGVVLTIIRGAINYLFDRAEYMRNTIRSSTKRVILGCIIIGLICLVVLIIINILGKYQIKKEHKSPGS